MPFKHFVSAYKEVDTGQVSTLRKTKFFNL